MHAVEQHGVAFDLRGRKYALGSVDHAVEQRGYGVLGVREREGTHLHELRVAADVR